MPSHTPIQMLLERAAGDHVVERCSRAQFDQVLLKSLHALAKALMAESYEHFEVHAFTNDEVHVFRRRASGEIVGFQFWKSLEGQAPEQRFVLGGKLRVRPSDRRHGLHLLSNLRVLLEVQEAFPHAEIVRLSIASLFGFCSIAKRVAHYQFVDAQCARPDLIHVVDRVTSASHYRFDPETGLVDVGIFMTDAQLSGYPAGFFATAEARAYTARNPRFRGNGCYLAWAFAVDEDNVRALARGCAQSALGLGPEAHALSETLVSGWSNARART